MTETPFGRDGTSAVDPPADPATPARSVGRSTAAGDRSRRPRPQPLQQGLPADTLALLLLLIVIIAVLSSGSFASY